MKIVLYHVITTYHLFEFIVHSIYNKNEYAVLLMPKSLANYYPNYEYLIRNKIMNEVFIMPDIVSGKDEIDVVNKIDSYVNENMRHIFDNDVEVHMAGAQFMFSAWLIQKEIPFIFYEEANGILSRAQKLRENVLAGNKQMYEIASKNGMFDGENILVIKKICNKLAQLPEYEFDEKTENYDVVATLEMLSDEEVREIIQFFTEVNEYNVRENSCLLLTQHFANLSILTYEQQVLLYQTVCDYFLNDYNIILKPHPFDFINYNDIFIDLAVIRERFPSELLPYMFNKRPKAIATISSTSIFTIKKMFNKSISFDFEFEKDFVKMSKYYGASLVANEFIEKGYVVNFVGINKSYIMNRFGEMTNINVYSSILEIEEFYGDEIYFMDVELLNEDIDVLYTSGINVLFLNTKELFDFYRYTYRECWNNINIYSIEKIAFKNEHIYIPLETEYMYAIGSLFKEIDISRTVIRLKYTGVDMSVEKLTNEMLEKKALEGKLAATENRLKFYIEQNRELQKHLSFYEENRMPHYIKKNQELEKQLKKYI